MIIMAVATKKELRTLHNILLACLAGTDLMISSLAQPLFITSEIKRILDLGPFCTFDIVIGIAGGTKHRRLHFHQVSPKIRRNRH